MPHGVRRPRAHRGQALVEFAVLLPVMLIFALGTVAIDSYVQAQSFLQSGVLEAALVGARDACDPCVPNQPFGPLCTDSTPANHYDGFNDVVMAFDDAMAAADSPYYLQGSAGKVDLVGASSAFYSLPSVDSTVSLNIECTSVNGTYATANSTSSARIAGLPADCTLPTYDGGCYGIWRGGTITVTATAQLHLSWIPVWQGSTIKTLAVEQIEPYRGHFCPAEAFVIDC